MGTKSVTMYRADVVIVGAGYAGLMAALTLGRAGRSVIVVDAQPLGGNTDSELGYNQSAISGGHVTYGYSQNYEGLAQKYGMDFAVSLFQLSVRGVDLVEKNCHDYNIADAAFHKGYVMLARNARDEEHLVEYLKQTEKFGKIIGKERLMNATETQSMIASPAFYCGSLYSSLHGQLEPRAYVLGLAQAAKDCGVQMIESVKIKTFQVSANEATAIAQNGDIYIGEQMIVSGGTGILRGGHFPVMRQYQATVGNYAVKTQPLPEHIIAQIFPSGYQGAFSDLRRSDVLYARLDSRNCLDFGAFSFGGAHPNAADVENLLYTTFSQLRDAGIGINSRRYGFLAGTRQEMVQIFQSQKGGQVLPVQKYDASSRLTVLSAFAAEGINLGTITGEAMANALLGDAANFNILAHIAHQKMPITFPWECANRLRDTFLAGLLSVVDKQASKTGLMSVFARGLARFV